MFERKEYFNSWHREACEIMRNVFARLGKSGEPRRDRPKYLATPFDATRCSCAYSANKANQCWWCKRKPNPRCVCGDHREHHNKKGCMICNNSINKSFHCKRFKKEPAHG